MHITDSVSTLMSPRSAKANFRISSPGYSDKTLVMQMLTIEQKSDIFVIPHDLFNQLGTDLELHWGLRYAEICDIKFNLPVNFTTLFIYVPVTKQNDLPICSAKKHNHYGTYTNKIWSIVYSKYSWAESFYNLTNECKKWFEICSKRSRIGPVTNHCE